MSKTPLKTYSIRQANPDEYNALGRLTVQIYRCLPGMPKETEQPQYYDMLNDVKSRAQRPTLQILVAVATDGELLGGVTFVGNMRHYDAGGTAQTYADCSGIRLLAVKPEARGHGVGKALTRTCIQIAAEQGSRGVILHTTNAMQIAWGMYLRMGFSRSPDLDFNQGNLPVFGFQLVLD